jgi:hypothetical protein
VAVGCKAEGDRVERLSFTDPYLNSVSSFLFCISIEHIPILHGREARQMATPATTTAIQSAAAASSNRSASSISPSNFTSDEGNSKATYSSKVGNAKGRVSENATAATAASR